MGFLGISTSTWGSIISGVVATVVTLPMGGVGGLLVGAACGGIAGMTFTWGTTGNFKKALETGAIDTVAGFAGGRFGGSAIGGALFGSQAVGRAVLGGVGVGVANQFMNRNDDKKPPPPSLPVIKQLPTVNIGNGTTGNINNDPTRKAGSIIPSEPDILHKFTGSMTGSVITTPGPPTGT